MQTPLDLAPLPDSRARRLFDQAQSTLTSRRSPPASSDDGGWMFGWDQWNATASIEWRGVAHAPRTPHLPRN